MRPSDGIIKFINAVTLALKKVRFSLILCPQESHAASFDRLRVKISEIIGSISFNTYFQKFVLSEILYQKIFTSLALDVASTPRKLTPLSPH